MDVLCKNYIDRNIGKELHIVCNEVRLTFHNSVKEIYILDFINEFIAIYRSVLSTSKSASQLTIRYYLQCHKVNCKKLTYLNIEDVLKNDVLQVLNFYCNAVFHVAQSQQESVSAQGRHKRKVATSKAITLLYTVPETERGLLSIAGGTLCDIFKKAVGKRHFRKLRHCKRHTQRNSSLHVALVNALRMTNDEKIHAPPSLLCRDRGGLIIPKLCLLPYIRQILDSVMQFATYDGIKLHGNRLLKVCSYPHLMLFLANLCIVDEVH